MTFQPWTLNHELLNFMVQKFMVRKSGVGNFMVERSGVEKFGVEMSFNPVGKVRGMKKS